MIEDINIYDLPKTPCYCYDMDLLGRTLSAIKEAASIDSRFRVHYAVKANFRPQILETISQAGLGADCVSGWEIAAAIESGFRVQDIVYAGVGKTDEEIISALRAGIGCFNVESFQEIEVINELAVCENRIANIAIRVNPEIDAHTHEYITTGLENNKFGILTDQLEAAVDLVNNLPGLKFIGFHFHIGSQITKFDCYELLCDRINGIVKRFTSKGINIGSINVGGGLGIDYENPDERPIADFGEYFMLFSKCLSLPSDTVVHFELGRSVVAQCGSLLTKVLFIKENPHHRFAIVDAGMTDLIRPALYKAHHAITPVMIKDNTGKRQKYDVVGPICESSDVFATNEELPILSRGDILALRSAGAYGEAMASNYNMRPLPSCYFYNL